MIRRVQLKLVDFYPPLKVKTKLLTGDQLDTAPLQQLLKMTENVAHTASTPHKQQNYKINKKLNYLNQILHPV